MSETALTFAALVIFGGAVAVAIAMTLAPLVIDTLHSLGAI